MRRGFALITVLWVILILGLFAAGIAEVARRDGRGLRAMEQAAQSEALLDSALEQGIWALRSASLAVPDIKADGVITELAAPTGTRLLVRIVPAQGLVDLNSAAPAVLSGLARAVRPDAERAAELARQIAGQQGRLASVDALPLESPAELARLRAIVTVGAANTAPLLDVAPAEVLAIVPGLSREDISRILEARRDGTSAALPTPPGWDPEPSEPRPTVPVYHITVGAEDARGLRRAYGVALVLPLPETRPTRPYYLLDHWTVPAQDGIFALIEDPE